MKTPLHLALMLSAAMLLPAAPAPAATPASAGTTQAPSDVYYEIFVRSWYDSDGDGTGDLNGVTAKLDYLKSLGVDGIWLMPINPSPSYHGYDITDYEAINPQYGTMADFERLLREAHQRGIKVVLDLVINHTSDESPWFKAAQDPHSPYRHWYEWATPATDLKAISATGGPLWHATPDGDHYLGVFVAQMPDLDYDTPAVRAEMIKVGRFWLDKGVDGFRLDAAQHIYDDRETDADNPVALKKNLAWWREFHQGIDVSNPHAWLVGEVARQNPDDLTPWMGALDAVFDFPLAIRLVDSAKEERDRDIGATLERMSAAYRAAAHGRYDNAPFRPTTTRNA